MLVIFLLCLSSESNAASLKNKTVLVREKDIAAYCGSSIAARPLRLMHCGLCIAVLPQ